MLDHIEDSVVRPFIHNTQDKKELRRTAEMRDILFHELSDLRILKAPVLDVEDGARHVFLTC